MTDSDRRNPDFIAKWAVRATTSSREHMRLWARKGAFCGPPEWRVLPALQKPSVGMGWVEVAVLTVDAASGASDDWFALYRIADQVAEAMAGL